MVRELQWGSVNASLTPGLLATGAGTESQVSPQAMGHLHIRLTLQGYGPQGAETTGQREHRSGESQAVAASLGPRTCPELITSPLINALELWYLVHMTSTTKTSPPKAQGCVSLRRDPR